MTKESKKIEKLHRLRAIQHLLTKESLVHTMDCQELTIRDGQGRDITNYVMAVYNGMLEQQEWYEKEILRLNEENEIPQEQNQILAEQIQDQ